MCLFTHFAAGALAGGLTGNVYLGAAAGLASHAVLDVVPHYDHPDWRIELGGGLLSLVLLLLMPFSSWPAVVGGIFGMVPDLENLFQKLGRMGRDRFIFPTHTGLLPHGRELGPRTLVWQVAIFVVCFVALGLANPGAAQAADAVSRAAEMDQPQVRLLSSGAGRTVVRIDFPVLRHPDDWRSVGDQDVKWSLPRFVADEYTDNPRLLPPRMNLSLAVPTRQPVDAKVVDVTWWREPVEPVVPGDLLTMGDPGVFRSVPLVGGQVALGVKGGIVAGVTVEISHPASGAVRRQLDLGLGYDKSGRSDTWTATIPAGLLNPELFRVLARGGREDVLARSARDKAPAFDPFALTTHWVKLDVAASGLYRLTGQELLVMGVPTSDIDPAKLRLFRGGGLALAVDADVPDSLQSDRIELNEVAIEVVGGTDGEWNLDDEIRFYGVPSSAWLDRFEPGASRGDHYDHNFADHATYWLTWESAAVPSPLPGAPRRVAAVDAAPTGGAAVSTALLRMHKERQVLDTPGYFADNWSWDNTITSSRPEYFSPRTPVPGSTARFVIDIAGIYPRTLWSYTFEAIGYLNDDQANQGYVAFSRQAQNDSLRLRIFGESQSIKSGVNLITLRNINNNPGEKTQALALDSYDIFYWAGLDLTDQPGQLEFAHWGESVPAFGTPVDLNLTAPDGVTPLVWDVTDPAAAAVFAGTAQGASPAVFTYGLVRDPDSDRHFVATAPGDLLSVEQGRRTNPVSLRSMSPEVDYLVVHPAAFAGPAAELADFHSDFLPGVASPRAVSVSLTDIYDNFAGGQKDAFAIRNFLKHVYEAGGHRLKYVCFLGNTSRDFRYYKDPNPDFELYDFVPTDMRTNFPVFPASYGDKAYASDDGLVSFESGSYYVPDVPDLVCGRLPANSPAEARGLVDRVIRYAGSPEQGLWSNRVLITADDNVTFSTWPVPQSGEDVHTVQAEEISNTLLAHSLDVTKLYGNAYDFPPSSRVKPSMRQDINSELSAGTTIYYYVGHGAEDNLADEQVFQAGDISNLTNGMKRPIFVAFSCDVGVFDSPSRLSMAEQFVLAPNGGAIGAICASQVSWTPPNDLLSTAFFQNLYPGRKVSRTVTPADALFMAKGQVGSGNYLNAQRYNYMGDPGMLMAHPTDDLAFTAASLDTLKAGALQSAVVDASGASFLFGAGDSYDLLVHDARFDQGYIKGYRDSFVATGVYVRVPTWNTFVATGSPVFIGTGVVGSGDLKVDFKAPTKIRYGEEARLRMIVRSGDDQHSVARYVPSVPSSTGPSDDIVGPAIGLSFEDERFRVTRGTPLNASLVDTSGIAILGTTPGNSLLMEFDDSGFMTDVTGSFAYEANSYTTGSLSIPLPGDLSMGPHLVALHASDALGNVGTDTLSFEVGPEGVVGIDKITLFPNPTPGPCRLIFELSDPMEVQWEIYTLAGRRIRTITEPFASAGPLILEWDGRDSAGDEIANGTYLYVLRRTWNLAPRPGGEQGRDLTKTGKLVIMR